MEFHYISPSTFPSRSANSVHVALQCEALVRAGASVTLYAQRTVRTSDALVAALRDAYGIDATGIRLITYFGTSPHAISLKIAALALARLSMAPARVPVLSRNLYASYGVAVMLRRPMLFETHQLEYGPRKRLQGAVMTRPNVTTVTISESLTRELTSHHGVPPRRALVMPDAAPGDIAPIPTGQRRAALHRLVPGIEGPWRAVCGYFGHLYEGRGIQLIEAMAKARPDVLFLLFGGNDDQIEVCRAANAHPNLRYLGHIPHPLACRVMPAMDVLLMPYQLKVAIAAAATAARDTARWMSPMKMFEYLASGVPTIASDLPALREILRHGENAILAAPDRPDEWLAALDRLLDAPADAARLGACAHGEARARFTWETRAQRLLAAAAAL
jgi:glycosyltransferase involved in cell wall biosynthesis